MFYNHSNHKISFLASWLVESYNRTGNWDNIDSKDLQELETCELKSLNLKVTELILKSGKGLEAIKSFKSFQLSQFSGYQYCHLKSLIFRSQLHIAYAEEVQDIVERSLRLADMIDALGVENKSIERLKSESKEQMNRLQSADGIENAASSDIARQEKIFFDLYNESIKQLEDSETKKMLRKRLIDFLLTKKERPIPAIPERGYTAIHLAALNNDLRVLKVLKKQLTPIEFIEELNRPNEKGGLSPIFFALGSKNYVFVDALIAEGVDINSSNDEGFVPLDFIIHDKEQLKEVFEKYGHRLDLHRKTVTNENLLHSLVRNNQADQITFFKEKYPEIFITWLEEKNIYGESPLDIALQEKCDSAIILLDSIPHGELASHPKYGVKQTDINQSLILAQMVRYTQSLGRDSSVIPIAGACNGFSFLYLYYEAHERGNEFFNILKTISEVNEEFFELLKTFSQGKISDKEQELLKKYPLPLSLSGKYSNLAELFEQTINDAIWFQAENHDHPLKHLGLLSLQGERERQLQGVRRDKSTLDSELSFETSVNKEELSEWLTEIAKQGTGTIIEFGGEGHATGAIVTQKGMYKYYDPNFNREMPADSPQKIASILLNTKYKALGKLAKDSTGFVQIKVYHYKTENSLLNRSSIAPQIDKEEKNTPNNFSSLHLSIFDDDFKEGEELLKNTSIDPNEADKAGISPLELSISLKKNKIALKLLEHPKINLNSFLGDHRPILAAIKSNNEEIFAILIQKEELNTKGMLYEIIKHDRNNLLKLLFAANTPFVVDPNEEMYFPLTEAIKRGNAEAIGLLMDHGAKYFKKTSWGEPATQILESLDVDCITVFVDHMNDLNLKNEREQTLLEMAVDKGNCFLVDYLVKKGAKIENDTLQQAIEKMRGAPGRAPPT